MEIKVVVVSTPEDKVRSLLALYRFYEDEKPERLMILSKLAAKDKSPTPSKTRDVVTM